MYLSIVIPAYNEERCIVPSVATVRAYMAKQSYDYEIVVVDDASADRTVALIEEAYGDCDDVRYVSYAPNRGKGYAVNCGFMAAKGERVLFSDADLSTPIEETAKLLAKLDDGLDLVIGSRGTEASVIEVHQPWYREFSGRLFNKCVKLILIGDFNDTQCGFKLFQKASCLPIFRLQRLSRFSFDVELLFLAKKKGLKAGEVPIRWLNDADSRVSFFRDAPRMFLDLLKVRFWFCVGMYRGEGVERGALHRAD